MSDPYGDVKMFTEALQFPAEDRASFLETACGDDAALRRRVEALLKAHDRAGDFLDETPDGFGATAETAAGMVEKPGDRIGRYKLLQQIGEGGCGVVFMAEQEEPVRRLVALKVIKPGMDTASVIARFEAERQALALMEHSNIAKVFDAGATEAGRPYFVMELVRGVKITDYCDQHSLTTSARLDLFVQICEAVQHAHQKGVIHRDLKPSNILVTVSEKGQALPMVIDFGIAKATTGTQLTDKTLFTAFEMLIGTPAYMSPEQAAFASTDVDTRSDIYSLGVLLYELLTGTTPFDAQELLKAGLDEVRRVIRNQEPVRPSTRLIGMVAADLTSVSHQRQAEPPGLIREVRGDLDWIVMKAMEKDRARRYQTANGLAQDVQRYLTHQTVSARPPGWFYKLRKLSRRNRLIFWSAAAVVLSLVAGLTISMWLLGRERKAREDADEARNQADAERKAALTAAVQSGEVTRFLEEMLEGVGTSVALGRDTALLREILDKTATRLDKELADQPSVQAELRQRLADTYWQIGLYTEAETMLRQASAGIAALTGEDSGEARSVRKQLADVLILQAKWPEAEALMRPLLEYCRSPRNDDPLKKAAACTSMGAILWERHHEESESLLNEALAIYREKLGDSHHILCETLILLGRMHFKAGRMDKAEALFRWAADNWRAALGENHPNVVIAEQDLAATLRDREKLAEGEALLRRGLAVRRRVYAPEHRLIAYSLYALGKSLITQKKNLDEAEALLREALDVLRKMKKDTDPDVIAVFDSLVSVLIKLHKPAAVDGVLHDILPPARNLRREVLPLLCERREARARAQQWQDAAADAALLVAEEPEEHQHYHALAPLLVRCGDHGAYARLCRVILEKFGGTDDLYVADRMAKDCLICPLADFDLAPVERLAELAVHKGAALPALPFFQVCRAMAALRKGEYRQAAEWAEKAGSTSFPHVAAEAQAVLAIAFFKLGDAAGGQAALIKALTIVQTRIPPAGAPDIGSDWRDWIIAHALLEEASALGSAGP